MKHLSQASTSSEGAKVGCGSRGEKAEEENQEGAVTETETEDQCSHHACDDTDPLAHVSNVFSTRAGCHVNGLSRTEADWYSS